MTPAQEAKEYAAQHGFALCPRGRKYYVGYVGIDGNEIEIAEVSGYPAALNAMKRYVQEQAESAARDFPFKDDASKARIRAEARRIRAEARRITKPAEGSPEWFARRPWRIVSSGSQMSAHAMRSDALKVVRRVAAGRSDISIVYMGA